MSKIKKSDCHGCYKEFYNCGGVDGKTNKCWSFDGAAKSLGRIHSIDALPENYRGRFKLIPDCYRKQRFFIERKSND